MWYLEYFVCNCPQLNVTGPHRWLVNIDSVNDLVSPGSKSSHEPTLIQIYIAMVTRPQCVKGWIRKTPKYSCFIPIMVYGVTLSELLWYQYHYCVWVSNSCGEKPAWQIYCTQSSFHHVSTERKLFYVWHVVILIKRELRLTKWWSNARGFAATYINFANGGMLSSSWVTCGPFYSHQLLLVPP